MKQHTKSNNNRRHANRLNYQNLEVRNLLAADLVGASVPVDAINNYLAHTGQTEALFQEEQGVQFVDTRESDGLTTTLLQKTNLGIPVFGEYVTVTQNASGSVEEIKGNLNSFVFGESSTPTFASDAAEQIAIGEIDGNIERVSTQLVWHNSGELAWQVDTYLERNNGFTTPNLSTLVDARLGSLIVSETPTANHQLLYDPTTKTGIFERIVINDTIGASGSQAYAAQDEFAAVVDLPGCTGSLIAPNVVISARHCGSAAGQTVQFGPDSSNPIHSETVASVTVPAGAGSLLDGGDFNILILDNDIPEDIATPYRLITWTDQLEGQLAATVGYGANGIGSEGHNGSSDGLRWGGENIIDVYGVPAAATGANIISTDFDDGTAGANTITGSDANPIEFEATTAPGDSGGPILIQVEGEWVVAGVLSGGTNGNSLYGDISWWTGVQPYQAEIEAVGGVFTDGEPVDQDIDDQISEATFAPNGSSFGTIDTDTDVDLWQITAIAGDTITIDIDVANEDLDSYLRLFDANGVELAASDDDAGPGAEPHNRESYLSYVFADSGDYYFGVSSFGNDVYDAVTGGGDQVTSTLGNYEVIVEVADFDDQISEAITAPLGSTMAAIVSGVDVDMWQISLTAGQQVDIDLDIAGQDLDSMLRLFDSSGTELAVSDDDVGPGAEPHIRESFISFVAPADGTYYFGVSSYNNVAYDPLTGTGDVSGFAIGSYELIVELSTAETAEIVGQQIFYNGSSFDASSNVDAASGKTALMPGQTATFANYSSYTKGINGLMVEATDLATVPTVDNIGDFFEFRVGNDNDVSGWASAAAPIDVTVAVNVDGNGTDQVFVTWADNAIQNTWLEVTSLANATTGLATPSTFYFGNAIGETGNDAGSAQVNLVDVGLTRGNQTGFTGAAIDNAYDFDRDGRVNLIDVAIARSNQSGFTPLQLITPSTSGSRGVTSGIDGNTKATDIQDFSTLSSVDPASTSRLDNAFALMIGKDQLAVSESLAGSLDVSEVPQTETVVRELGVKKDAVLSDELVVEFDSWV
jgi:hypothetical protein